MLQQRCRPHKGTRFGSIDGTSRIRPDKRANQFSFWGCPRKHDRYLAVEDAHALCELDETLHGPTTELSILTPHMKCYRTSSLGVNMLAPPTRAPFLYFPVRAREGRKKRFRKAGVDKTRQADERLPHRLV